MSKVILDVDTGVDDALAIIYAIESKKIDFLGITTVSSNDPLHMTERRFIQDFINILKQA